MKINEHLKKIYQEHWDNLLNYLYAFDQSDEYTSPLLLKFPDDYFKAVNKRIMFFGQETRGWQDKVNNELKSIDIIMDGYERYFIDNNMKYKDSKSKKMISRSSFRSGILNLKKGLKKRNLGVDLIWNNINKIGRHCDKVGVNAKIKQIELDKFNVISKEIAVLKPDFIIFFTGPYRDKEILSKFPDVTIDRYQNLNSKELVVLRNADGKIIGFRTYHPNYLKGFYPMLNSYCFDIIETAINK